MSDPVENFAVAQLAEGITAAAVTLEVASGQGARFPDPASDGAFNVVVWDNLYANAAEAYQDGKAEIVRVTARSSDTFTITRAQESTTARAFNTSGRTYNVELNATAKTFTDMQGVSPSKLYVATLTQSGTSAPVATIIKNTLSGTPTLARTSAGVYTLTLTDEFTADKVSVWFSARDDNAQPQVTDAYRTSVSVVTFKTFDLDGWSGTIKVEIFS